MFVVVIKYKKPLERVDAVLAEHRAYLDEGYRNHYFIASGPCNPRTGGIILSQLKNREQLDEIIKHDPFYTQHIADFEVIEFNPVKFAADFASFV